MPLHENSYWAIETADWLVEADGGTLLLAAADDSALLRIDTLGGWAPDWHNLVAQAGRRVRDGSAIEPVSCGDFSGVTYEAGDPEGDYCREWLLTLGELFLLVSYSTAEQYRDRDRVLVDRLLSTLADRRA